MTGRGGGGVLQRICRWRRERSEAHIRKGLSGQTVDDFDLGVPVRVWLPGRDPQYGYIHKIHVDHLVVTLERGGGELRTTPSETEYL